MSKDPFVIRAVICDSLPHLSKAMIVRSVGVDDRETISTSERVPSR